MAKLHTPRCPLCRSFPVLVLAGGRQAFCGDDDCDVVCWNMLSTLDENLTDVGHVKITENVVLEALEPPATD